MSRKNFLDQIAHNAQTERPVMPWTRGARRAKAIARRRLAQQPKKAVAAR